MTAPTNIRLRIGMPDNKPQPGRRDSKNSGMNDLWKKTAIEKHYLGFPKERAEPGLPTMLAYLKEHRYDGYSQTVSGVLDDVILDLHAHLAAGSYAEALVEKVWNGEETLAEAMD